MLQTVGWQHSEIFPSIVSVTARAWDSKYLNESYDGAGALLFTSLGKPCHGAGAPSLPQGNLIPSGFLLPSHKASL